MTADYEFGNYETIKATSSYFTYRQSKGGTVEQRRKNGHLIHVQMQEAPHRPVLQEWFQ